MTKRKLILLVILFIIYEVLVWGLSLVFLLDSNYLLVGFVLTVCGVTVAAVYWLVNRLSAANRAAPVSGPPAEKAAAPGELSVGQEDDSGSVTALIREANEKLARSPTLAKQGLRHRVTDFPLYLLVGAKGSGKTSTFLASQLEPELLAGQVYQESVVASTRFGNVWFARGAIVVEAAGTLFSGDGAKWNRLISSFVSSRPPSRWSKLVGSTSRRPVGGVVLCCNLADFRGIPDAAKLAAMARVAQQRLRPVGELLGRDFPVYVLFTKADSIDYFSEYFGRLREQEEQQLLGCSFSAEGTAAPQAGVYAETETARISASLNRLYLSLVEKRLPYLARETDRAKKASMYEFPREFKRIRSNLVQFLVEVFRPNPLQPNPQLSGVYFTGTRKVVERANSAPTSMLDRTVIHKVGDVTRMLRVEDLQKLRSAPAEAGPREVEITRWAFVSELWQQILGTGAMTGASPSNARDQVYPKAIFGTAAAFCVILILLFIASFFQNRALVHRVEAAAGQVAPVQSGAQVSLANLRQIDGLRAEIDEIDSRPSIFQRFGFYEGKRLVEPALEVYFARFREYFLNPVLGRLETEFSSLPNGQDAAHPYQNTYSGLKVYRTVTSSRAEASCAPDASLTESMLSLWRQNGLTDVDAERIARANIQFYANTLKANRVPDALKSPSKDDGVRRAREYLNTFRGVEPQYHRIIDQVNAEKPAATLTDLMHNDKYRAVMRVPAEVPGAFTRNAWDRVQELIEAAGAGGSADSCVLGKTGTRSIVGLALGGDERAQLRELYINDYIRYWSDYVTKTSVLPFSGCSDAAQKLDILKDNTSPVLGALVLISINTTFPKHGAPPVKSLTESVKSGASGLRALLSRAKDAGKAKVAKALGDTSAGGISEDAITAFFQPAHAVFASSPPNPDRPVDPKNTPYLDALGGLQLAARAADQGGMCTSDLTKSPEAMKVQTAVNTLARGFDNQGASEGVKRLLESPFGALPAPPSQGAAVNAALHEVCTALGVLKNKYPFDPKGEDARLDAVATVFDPRSGKFAALRQTVGDQATRSPAGWVQKPDAPVKLSKSFLDFMGRMSAISDALFSQQGAGPAARYKLSVHPNSGLKQVTGTLDGEPFATEREYNWPPARPGINLRVEPSGGGSAPLRSYSGIWGIFQLLTNADEHPPGSNQFMMTYVQGGRGNKQGILEDSSPIVFEVIEFPNGVQRAFDSGFFNVSCPVRAAE